MSEKLFDKSIINNTSPNTSELHLARVAALPNGSAWGILERFGSYQTHEFPSGERITVLPTCTVPLDYLIRENWVKTRGLGNFREVAAIDRLSNGVNPNIVLKSPERVLTRNPRYLEAGYPFWDGPRSGHSSIWIRGNPVVEEQSVWEAIILLELHRIGVRAEVPQALLQDKSGKREIVVKKIDIYNDCLDNRPRPKKQGPTEKELREYIKANSQLEPDDLSSHNLPMDAGGYTYIIDVNRWAWSPVMDESRQRLVQTIIETRQEKQ